MVKVVPLSGPIPRRLTIRFQSVDPCDFSKCGKLNSAIVLASNCIQTLPCPVRKGEIQNLAEQLPIVPSRNLGEQRS